MVWVLINVYRLENLSSPISTLLDDSRLCKIDYDMKETYEIYAYAKGGSCWMNWVSINV